MFTVMLEALCECVTSWGGGGGGGNHIVKSSCIIVNIPYENQIT